MEHNQKLVYEAVYAFSGSNNDELCFKKGDIIVLTQQIEGGWWEGTLNEETGWFPSNYVKEYKPEDKELKSKLKESPPTSPIQPQGEYREEVMKNIIESEKKHVADLRNTLNKYIIPLQKSDLLKLSDYHLLIGNLEEVVLAHTRLQASLEQQLSKQDRDQQIGGVFLQHAATLKNVHSTYTSNHPKAVCVIERYKDELSAFMESNGAATPGALVLTTALSYVFRRLDKYPSILQEYQRHIDDAHPDRGNTQRSTHVYRDIMSTCNSIRRQKHFELEILTNKVKNWTEGETLSTLGDIIHMRSVALLPDNSDKYLIVFPTCLVILSLSPRASSFSFEAKYSLSDLTVSRLDDTGIYKNAFEIAGSHMDKLTAICQTKENQQQWVDILQAQIRLNRSSLGHSSHSSTPPAPPAHGSTTMLASTSTSVNHSDKTNPWRMSCLRPSPPIKQPLRDEKKYTKQLKKKDEKWFEEDTLILRVIEAYCTSSKSRYTVNSIDVGHVGPRGDTRSPLPCEGGHSSPLPSCLSSSPNSPPLSPFADMRLHKAANSNWCCGLAMRTLKKNIDFDC